MCLLSLLTNWMHPCWILKSIHLILLNILLYIYIYNVSIYFCLYSCPQPWLVHFAKLFILCSTDEWHKGSFIQVDKTWQWVNYDNFIYEWTIHFTCKCVTGLVTVQIKICLIKLILMLNISFSHLPFHIKAFIICCVVF